MKAYSEDLRKRIVDAVDRGMGKTEAARTFGVALSSVKRYVGMAREGWPLTPKKRPGLRPKIDEQGKRLLQADLAKRQGGGRAVRINRESLEAYMSGGAASARRM